MSEQWNGKLQMVRGGEPLTDNLLPRPHFTDEETEAQGRECLTHTPTPPLAGPALDPEAHVFLQTVYFEHLPCAGHRGCGNDAE